MVCGMLVDRRLPGGGSSAQRAIRRRPRRGPERAVTGGAVKVATDLDAASPYGRVCRPEDIADVVAFFVSEQAGYVTGQRVEVDGGGMAR